MPAPETETDSADASSVRLDVWLWRARFFRTRTLSADFVRRSGVRLTHAGQTRRVDKPAVLLVPGDVLTFKWGGTIASCEVLEPGERRGPATEAAALYRRIDIS